MFFGCGYFAFVIISGCGYCTSWICVLVLQWIWLPIFPCSIWWGGMRLNSWVAWEFTLLHYFSENTETFFQLEIFLGDIPIAILIRHCTWPKSGRDISISVSSISATCLGSLCSPNYKHWTQCLSLRQEWPNHLEV